MKGWHNESDRHALSAKGIQSGRRKTPTIKDKEFRKWLQRKNIDDRILLSLGTSGTIGAYKKEFLKEKKEHPSFTNKQIEQIVKDHKKEQKPKIKKI